MARYDYLANFDLENFCFILQTASQAGVMCNEDQHGCKPEEGNTHESTMEQNILEYLRRNVVSNKYIRSNPFKPS